MYRYDIRTASKRTRTVKKNTEPVVQAERIVSSSSKVKRTYALVPVSVSGIATVLIVLSALPETRSVADGLKRITVGGNSCALKTERRGYIPPLASEQNPLH